MNLEPEATPQELWRARGFGLQLDGDLVLPSLASTPDLRLSRRVVTARTTTQGLRNMWRSAKVKRILERRLVGGRVGMTVDRSDADGFRVWAPRHGSYLLLDHGQRLVGAPPAGCPTWRWERLVLAQVLPLAAAMHGLEPLHASAVVHHGAAIVFVGASGAGKTSTAFHAVNLGAQLLTDDILAVELANARAIGHPGSTVVRVDPAQIRTMPPAARAALIPPLARSDKYQLPLPVAGGPAPIAAVFELVRTDQEASDVSIADLDPSDPRPILGNSFLPYMADAERLRGQFAVCEAILRQAKVRRVSVPPGIGAAEVAELLLDTIGPP